MDTPPKRFPVPRTSLIEDLLTRVLLSIFTWVFLFIIAIGVTESFPERTKSGFILCLFFTTAFVFLLFWIPFLRHIREIKLDERKIIFRSYSGTKRTDGEDLLSIKVVKGGNYIKISSKKGSVLILPTVEKWHELMREIRIMNKGVLIGKDLEKQIAVANIKKRITQYSLLLAMIPAAVSSYFIPPYQRMMGFYFFNFTLYFVLSFLVVYSMIRVGVWVKHKLGQHRIPFSN